MGTRVFAGDGGDRKNTGNHRYGGIGQAVAYRARAFHMNVIYHSRTRLSSEEEQKLGVRWSSFFDLLEEADFVSLHAPYTPETHRLIGRQALKKMKKSAYLINTARGSLVDERALQKRCGIKKLPERRWMFTKGNRKFRQSSKKWKTLCWLPIWEVPPSKREKRWPTSPWKT